MTELATALGADGTRARRVLIGYVPANIRSSIAFPAPRLLLAGRATPLGPRAVQSCPAVNVFENRVIVIAAPFSLRLRCVKSHSGKYNIHVVDSGTRLDRDVIERHLTVMPREFWRIDSAPVIQIALPHFFVSDEVCYLSQLPAYASDDAVTIPGRLISGRFPLHIWPRSLNLAFEWTDLEADFVMKRGEAACYLTFETERPHVPIELVAAEATPELLKYRSAIEDVVKYTSGSFSLFVEAEKIRPKYLLKPAK